jgi:hypothetical protein
VLSSIVLPSLKLLNLVSVEFVPKGMYLHRFSDCVEAFDCSNLSHP